MLDLSGVTLCCIDTANHALALRALRLSSKDIRFARALLITDKAVAGAGSDIDLALIPPLESRDAYSTFVLKLLRSHVDTPHVLLVQWDGYVVNPGAWRADFLASDYIGAQWFWHDDGMRVGNGGFSLRSRKLLDALQDPRIELAEAEDVTICRAFRPLLERDYGIRFASEANADAFAFEAAYPIGKPFGFHGLFNFCRVVPPGELVALVDEFTPAIARSPQLLQLGRNCAALGQWSPAQAIFRRILDEDPANAAAAAGLASAAANAASLPPAGRNEPCPCGSSKRYKNCHGAIDSRISQVPRQPLVANLLKDALALHQSGNAGAAEAIYRDVLAREPDNALAGHFLGVIHYQRKDLSAALPLLERSVAAVPYEAEFHNNLGLGLAAADREADAIGAYRAALALAPDHAVAWNNLGLALQSLNEITPAIDAFRRAIALNPGFAQAHWNLALALLLDGQFAQGWLEYDWRLALSELGRDRHAYAGPAWDGSSADDGKLLLLYAEQGLGDALQFVRYATLLAEAGARTIIHCPASLSDLLATVPGVAQVVSGDEALPRYDAHCALMSLPRMFETTLELIPAPAPYVSVPAASRAATLAAMASIAAYPKQLKVGLAWAGSKAHTNDRNRSVGLAALAPLLGVPGIAWFSLQQGEAAAEIDAVGFGAKIKALPPTAALSDTAALIAELDLVISVDTSIAHLAGALGKPCWLLLPFAPDWRWLLDRDDSPWYPSMRLFRQPRPRDWSTVVGRAARELTALATQR